MEYGYNIAIKVMQKRIDTHSRCGFSNIKMLPCTVCTDYPTAQTPTAEERHKYAYLSHTYVRAVILITAGWSNVWTDR